MSAITEQVVRNVAKLARLAIVDDEIHTLAPQLNDILGYAEELQSVNLEGVAPTSHPFDTANVLRRDATRPSLPRDKALANSPDSDGEQVRVPAVLEG